MLVLLILQVSSLGIKKIYPAGSTNPINGPTLQQATLDVSANRDLGVCACDVTDQCDPNCCCDPDCPTYLSANTTFPFCLSETSVNDESQMRSLRKCSDPEFQGEGTILDWFQRTMLCIEVVNNPSPGTYYEIKDKDPIGSGFVETESSLFSVFSEPENPEESQMLLPLFTEINTSNIVGFSNDAIKGLPLPQLGSGFCSFSNKISYLEPIDTICRYEENETLLFNVTNPNYGSDSNLSQIFTNTSFCTNISFYENSTYNNESISAYACTFPSEVIITGVNCTTPTSCFAESVSVTNTTVLFVNDTSRANATYLPYEKQANVSRNLHVVLKWRTTSANEAQPIINRGYLFNEEILDGSGNIIEILAPSVGNLCNESKAGVLFGSDIDFTCFTEDFIDITFPNPNNTLTEADIVNAVNSTLDKDFSTDPLYQLDANNFRQAPVMGNQANNTLSITKNNLTVRKVLSYFNSTIYLSEVTRSIDIFYSTIGLTKNPQHILESIVVNYNYSTINSETSSNLYYSQYNMVALRTVIRYFEYPNSVNLYKETSVDRNIQAWLPF